MEYNFYCDESCHLINDGNNIMVLGGIWCPKTDARSINDHIRAIKAANGIGISTEMKWVKISHHKESAYLDLISYFFDEPNLHFRGLIVDNKNDLNHEAFKQTHDDWYYKMYFQMIKTILSPNDEYNIYLDIKDTRSKTKITKLHDVLSNSIYDFSHTTIKNIQVIRSEEVEIMQIVDILIGALAYFSRGLCKVDAKNDMLKFIKERSGYNLRKSTLALERKFNIFHLKLQEVNKNE